MDPSNDTSESDSFEKVHDDNLALLMEDVLQEICSSLTDYVSDPVQICDPDRLKWCMRRIPGTVDSLPGPFKVLAMIMKKLHAFLQAPTPLLAQEIVDSISNLLHETCPLDLRELYKLLKQSQTEASSIEGQDIVLLIGSSGSGKTTTLLRLAGVEFAEQEVDGSDHYEPCQFPSEELKAFRTGCGGTSVTRTIQSFPVKLECGKTIVVCDSPGFGDSAGPVMEIVNAMGLCRALQSARSVRPVVVISCDSLGDRFQGLKETMKTITRMTGCNCKDFEAFHYLFTKSVDQRDSTRIGKRMGKLLQDLDSADSWLKPLLTDMVQKTTPNAPIVSLSSNQGHESSRSSILTHLVDDVGGLGDPKNFFSPPFPHAVLSLLQNQLTMNLKLLKLDFTCQNYNAVMTRMRILKDIASVLEEEADTWKEAQDKFRLEVRRIADVLNRHVVELGASDGTHALFTKTIASFKQNLYVLEAMQELTILCHVDFKAIYEDSVEAMFRCIGKEILDLNIHPKNSGDLETIFAKKTAIKISLLRMKDALQRFRDCCGSEAGVRISREVFTRFSSLAGTMAKTARSFLELGPCAFPRFCDCLAFIGDLAPSVTAFHSQLMLHRQNTQQSDWLVKRHQQLLGMLEKKLCSSKLALEKVSREMDCHNLPSNSFLVKLEEHRLLLIVVRERLDTTGFDKIKGIDGLPEVILSFESALIQNLRRATKEGEKTLSEIRDDTDQDPSTAENSVTSLLKHLSHVERVFERIDNWTPRFQESMDEERKDLHAIQASARDLSKNLKSEAAKLVREISQATTICSTFVDELAEGDASRCSEVLDEVAKPHNWPSWQKLADNAKATNMNFLQRFANYFWFNNKKGSQELAQHMQSLASRFQQVLLNCVSRITWVLDTSEDSLTAAKSVLKTLSGQLRLLLAFIRVQVNLPCLARHILEHQEYGHLSDGLENAIESLRCTIDNVAAHPKVLVDQMNIPDLAVLLDIWRCSPSLSAFDGFLVIFLPKGHCAQRLQKSIALFPKYDDLVYDAEGLIAIIREKIQKISFHTSAVDVIEHSIFVVCMDVAETVQKAKLLIKLEDHMDKDEIIRIRAEASSKVKRESGNVASHLNKLLDSFPNYHVEFPRIHSCLLHLECIADAFFPVDTEVASNAYGHFENASRTFEAKLHEILRMTETLPSSVSSKSILMKKASFQIPCWSGRINVMIDEMILKSSQAASDRGKFLLDLFLLINTVEGEDATFARQLLLDHNCFEGGQNAIFNRATAKQTIDYVVERIQMPENIKSDLKHSYACFSTNYEQIILDYIPVHTDHSKMEECLDDIVMATRSTAVDFSIRYETQLCKMVANVFAYWTLSKSDTLSVARDNSSKYLLRPHPAQVVAILLMLNSSSKNFQNLESHLVEIKTGEGKSIVLGVVSIVLAMFNCEVVCACYSAFLSNRDYHDFKCMFEAFGVSSLISYSTLMDLGFAARPDDQVRDIVKRHVQRSSGVVEDSQTRRSESGPRRLRVLLLDEADVLFSPEVYGDTFHSKLRLGADGEKGKEIKDLFKFFGENRETKEKSELLASEEAREVLKNISPDAQEIAKLQLKRIIKDAVSVGKGEKHKSYNIIDGRIHYKYFDGTTTRYSYSYKTLFTYMKEAEKGNVSSEQVESRMNLRIGIGTISYAEVPFLFDVILGVSGTLKDLRLEEKNVLETDYGIEKYSYVPSVYGNNKLKFAGDSEHGTSSTFLVEVCMLPDPTHKNVSRC